MWHYWVIKQSTDLHSRGNGVATEWFSQQFTVHIYCLCRVGNKYRHTYTRREHSLFHIHSGEVQNTRSPRQHAWMPQALKLKTWQATDNINTILYVTYWAENHITTPNTPLPPVQNTTDSVPFRKWTTHKTSSARWLTPAVSQAPRIYSAIYTIGPGLCHTHWGHPLIKQLVTPLHH